MTEEDKYHTFLQKAITAPNVDAKYWYCLDRKLNTLLKVEAVDSNLEKLEKYTELPKLDYASKLEFVKKFSETQSPKIKELVLKLANSFKQDSEFNLEKEIREIDLDVANDFYFKSGSFIYEKITELYKELELNERMEVIL